MQLLKATVAVALFVVSVRARAHGQRFGHENNSPLTAKEQGVFDNLQSSATHSWEWGVESEVILELFYPSLSVFSSQPILPIRSNSPTPTLLAKLIDPVLSTADPNVNPLLVDGDGSAGDPMSLETAVLILNVTHGGSRNSEYALRAEKQLDHLLNAVPRTTDGAIGAGAISHREYELQLWNDFLYQAPPGIALYGLVTSNISLLEEAYNQCRLYRAYLRDPTTNLWRHIMLGSWQDTGLWSSGNGWAAAGMMRVLMTLEQAPQFSAQTRAWKQDLVSWMKEILDAAWTYQGNATLLLPNYLDRSDPRAFDEVSGTALLAATTLRLAKYTKGLATLKSLIPALRARKVVWEQHIKPDGIVFPVVNPLDWNQGYAFNGTSPEGQAFTLLMQTAYKELLACDWSRKYGVF